VPFFTILNIVMHFVYLTLRVACIIFAQNLSGEIYIQAWVFIAIELGVTIPPMMHQIWTMLALKKRGRPQLRIIGDNVPTVDCFITCCGEDDEVVMDTVRAACDIDYPWDKFRVIILDDGKSEGLEKMSAALALTYPNLYYIARPKYPGVPHHFKAGNLNYGLEQVHLMPGGAYQYMAALDADMVNFTVPNTHANSLTFYRFPSPAGFVPSCLIWYKIPSLPWLAPLSCSITHPRPTPCHRVSISSCTSLSPSRTLWVSPGALDLATSFVVMLWTR
jgi:hypothetical protein